MSVRLLCLLLLALLPGAALAERAQSFGDYRIHYNAFGSGFLSPEIARDYGILRSRTRGVLVVSVQEDGEPVPARVQATAAKAGTEPRRVELREVRQAGSVLYVGSVKIDDGETLRFNLEVTPEGAKTPFSVHFRQQFFSE